LYQLFKTDGTENKLYFWCRSSYATDMIFLCRLIKMVNIKNKNLFLVPIEIIIQHHKQILGVSINHFSTSVYNGECPSSFMSNSISLLFVLVRFYILVSCLISSYGTPPHNSLCGLHLYYFFLYYIKTLSP
jgi:hypothetical protein